MSDRSYNTPSSPGSSTGPRTPANNANAADAPAAGAAGRARSLHYTPHSSQTDFSEPNSSSAPRTPSVGSLGPQSAAHSHGSQSPYTSAGAGSSAGGSAGHERPIGLRRRELGIGAYYASPRSFRSTPSAANASASSARGPVTPGSARGRNNNANNNNNSSDASSSARDRGSSGSDGHGGGGGSSGGRGGDDDNEEEPPSSQGPGSTGGAASSAAHQQRMASDEKTWGAPFALAECYARCHAFLVGYIDEASAAGTESSLASAAAAAVPGQACPALYVKVLDEGEDWDLKFVNFDSAHLHQFDPVLYQWLVHYPHYVVEMLDLAINEIRDARHPAAAAVGRARVNMRPYGLITPTAMRQIDPSAIDTLVSIKGMVVRTGSVLPELSIACFKCCACNAETQSNVEHGEVKEPARCVVCQRARSMQLMHNLNTFTDKQLIKIQETPDEVPDGETPHTFTVFAYEDLVDAVKPGDRIEITGVYRAQPVRVNPKRRAQRSVLRAYLDTVHFKKLAAHGAAPGVTAESAEQAAAMALALSNSNGDSAGAGAGGGGAGRGGDGGQTLQAVRERLEAEVRALATDRNVYNRLVKSLAPSIYRMDDVKKGLLCLLFGGSNAGVGAGQGRFRGELNVLMCGDPGTSKSQLLQYVHKLAPRGIYTSGKGSSAVGLTAYIARDPASRELVLESGALVLSDRGVCCIDEFDKMNESTRSTLHEVMEQQTVSIAKAGIVCTLNARTSILASANPKQSRYNPRLSVVENIELGPTLLSRFDLIYLILDQPNAASDLHLARHLIGMYYADRDAPARAADVIPTQTLAHYISYARRHVHPELDNDAATALVDAYVELREKGNTGNRRIVTATPRQLESLIRLSEALARMRLSPVVTRWEVDEAKRLMQVATQATATDAATGRIDMSILTTGVSSSDRETAQARIAEVIEHCRTHLMATQARKMTIARFRALCMEAVGLSSAVANLLVEQITFERVAVKEGQMLNFSNLQF